MKSLPKKEFVLPYFLFQHVNNNRKQYPVSDKPKFPNNGPWFSVINYPLIFKHARNWKI